MTNNEYYSFRQLNRTGIWPNEWNIQQCWWKWVNEFHSGKVTDSSLSVWNIADLSEFIKPQAYYIDKLIVYEREKMKRTTSAHLIDYFLVFWRGDDFESTQIDTLIRSHDNIDLPRENDLPCSTGNNCPNFCNVIVTEKMKNEERNKSFFVLTCSKRDHRGDAPLQLKIFISAWSESTTATISCLWNMYRRLSSNSSPCRKFPFDRGKGLFYKIFCFILMDELGVNTPFSISSESPDYRLEDLDWLKVPLQTRN